MSIATSKWFCFGALALFILDGCAVGGRCHGTSDCRKGLECAGPNDPQGCGIPPRQECASDTDCSPQVCSAGYDPCSASGLGSTCAPPCTSTSCGPGLRCNAGRACEPIPCDEGTACPVQQRCDVAVAHAGGPVYNRTSGCVNISCGNDADCAAHGDACVNGQCHDGIGHCVEVMLIP